VAVSSELKIERGYFGLGDSVNVVQVTSTADFTVNIWARNVGTFHGGVQIDTPASQFRAPGSTGDEDGLVLDVPAQTGLNLGLIGGRRHEVISISNSSGARMGVFLTVVTAHGATVDMTIQ
jgi:hypothetical protein